MISGAVIRVLYILSEECSMAALDDVDMEPAIALTRAFF